MLRGQLVFNMSWIKRDSRRRSTINLTKPTINSHKKQSFLMFLSIAAKEKSELSATKEEESILRIMLPIGPTLRAWC